jgi:DNA-directed RNA polymerase specialized sigma24 family protein
MTEETLLSDREAELLEHLEDTIKTRNLAKRMDVRISTVHTYLNRIDQKQKKAQTTLDRLDGIDYDERRKRMTRKGGGV